MEDRLTGVLNLDVARNPKNFRLDVITIDKTGENFRLVYDVKGRFTIHRITAEEGKVRV